jgi:formate/nitrite transporter FocA (FNT family)
MSDSNNHNSIDALLPPEMAARAQQAFIHGVLANVLVCLATWLCYSARTTTDKILAIVFPIAAFSAAGFEHSIANMYLLGFALLTKFGAPHAFWDAIGKTPALFSYLNVSSTLLNLAWVTLGNMVGGAMVGIAYWFIYLRNSSTRIRPGR